MTPLAESGRARPPGSQDGILIGDLLGMIWRRKALVAACALLFGALGAFVAMRAKPKYVAVSKFICQGSSGQRSTDLGALASLAGLQMPSSNSTDPSSHLNEIVEDDEFLQGILGRKLSYGGDSLTLIQILGAKPDSAREDWEYVFLKQNVSTLRGGKHIALSKNKGNGVFTLETTFGNPKVAYQVNKEILVALAGYLSNSFLTKAREKRLFIEKRVQEIEAELRKDEDNLVGYRQRNRDVTAPAVLVELARLERAVRVNQEIYLQLKKEFEIAKIDERNDTPLLEYLSKPSVPISKARDKKRLLPVAGALLGFTAGALLALALAWRRGEFA